MMISEFVQSALYNVLFQPPKRKPLSEIPKHDHDAMLNAIDGETIHTRVIFPEQSRPTTECYSTHNGQIMIMCHGNADDITSFSSYAQFIADHINSNVIIFDYPGYGFSSGDHNTTDTKMFLAVSAVLRYVTENLQHPIKTITVYGKSIGSVPAIQLMSQPYMAGAAGLILISPIASGIRCIKQSEYLPEYVLTRMDLLFAPSIHRIDNVQSLILIIHGMNDQLVPVKNAEELMARANTATFYPPLFVEAGHNDIESIFKNLFISTLLDFTQSCLDKQYFIDAESPYDLN